MFDKDRLISQSGGQTSRIDALQNCFYKLKLKHEYKKFKNLSLFSDAFFPFTDSLELIKKENLKVMIKDYNLKKKIKLVGFKRNISKYYKKANLFINASHFEGFPNAVVEAISHNLPVICSNSKGGIKEIILNGRGGDLFRVNDADHLSKKITSYCRDPKKLNKKLISFEGRFQFSVEKVNKVKKFIFLLIDWLTIFSIVFKP